MSEAPVLTTGRLILRGWREEDREPFAALNADPEVMEVFPRPLTRAESDAAIDRFQAAWRSSPPSVWAVERRGGGLVGMVGMLRREAGHPHAPCVEIAWRLARAAWGHGYATEAARAALAHCFGTIGLAEVVSCAVPRNTRSHAVMARLGLRRDPAGDFDHPGVPDGHPSRFHWFCRLRAADWAAQ